jgi:hypothetical protein
MVVDEEGLDEKLILIYEVIDYLLEQKFLID